MPIEYIWPIVLTIFIIIDIAIIWLVFRWWKKRGFTNLQKLKYKKHWQKILNYPQLSQAILEADKLLYIVLEAKGYEGTLGDKLKKSKGLFSDYNGIWFAHKLRNRLAHELNIYINDGDSQKAMKMFEKALKDLGAL